MKTLRCQWFTRLACAVGLLLSLDTAAFGQQSLRGSIVGTVRDDTGAALPGVTISATSPALQVPQVLRISDERGEYQMISLPAGTYRMAYEHAGFATLVREGIVLTTGFVARIDVALKIATLAETITVSGEIPLVDITSTRGGTTVSKDLIAAVPINQNYQDVLLLVGGVNVTSPPLTGRIRAGSGGFAGSTYGAGGGTAVIEGVKMNSNEVPDFTAFQVVDVKTFGNTADIDTPGAAVQMVVKSGGNQFHGKYKGIVQHERFQANNVDAALRAQGITTGDTIVYYNDFAADLGGRIIPDKLWFYGAFRDLRNKSTVTGYAKDPGPDGIYGNVDDTPGFPTATHNSYTVKLSYQATPKHRFVGFAQYNPDFEYENRGDRFVPRESSLHLNQYSLEYKPIEWQGALSNRLLVNMIYAKGGYNAVYWFLGDWAPGSRAPARLNRATGFNTGPSFHANAVRRNSPTRDQYSGSVTYLPAGSVLGSHDIQTGYRIWRGSQVYENPYDPARNGGIGEYQLVYDTVGGVPNQPVELVAKNFPVSGRSGQNSYAWYMMDSWRPAKRLTVNLGLRWERQVYYVPPQVKVQGTFGTSGSFPAVDAGKFSALAPRVGVAFDLSGDGKTVIKATYGRFNDDLGVSYASAYNENSLVFYRFRWRDLNGDRNYQPGEVNLDLNGPDFLSVSGATNNRVNPDLRLPHTHEATGSLERDLGKGLSIRGLFVYKNIVDDYQSTNVLRPYSVYNRVFTRRDPGTDGVLNTSDDGELFTLYDYDPAYRGGAFVANMNTNTPADRRDSFKNVEVMLTKRQSGTWFANTSFLATKNHQWLVKVPQSPNDSINALDETWEMSYRLAGGYSAPFGINLSTLCQAYTGLKRQRTNIFRAADPAGGPAFPSSSTITMRMEPYGARHGDARHIVNLRAEKSLNLRGGRRLTAGVDAFNAFNSNVAWGTTVSGANAINDQSGPTYGYVVRVVYPRVLRFGIGYEF